MAANRAERALTVGACLRGCPPPCGRNPRGARGVYRGADLIFFLPVHPFFILPVFFVSVFHYLLPLHLCILCIPARVILNNRYPARGVPAGYTAGLPTGGGAPSKGDKGEGGCKIFLIINLKIFWCSHFQLIWNQCKAIFFRSLDFGRSGKDPNFF